MSGLYPLNSKRIKNSESPLTAGSAPPGREQLRSLEIQISAYKNMIKMPS